MARVTLWMGHKIAVDRLGLDEATLPLADLSGIRQADALRVPWPRSDAIIGNPPFHGDRNLRALLGDEYIDWLIEEFDVGVKDYCVYWFRRAHDHLQPGQRAGLVGTNSISQNRARGASLNYIVENDGVIVNAVSTQDWPGAANVDVSIVNWIREPDQRPSVAVLDGTEVAGIDTALRPSTVPIADVAPLPENRGLAFQGYLPGAPFDIPPAEAEALLADQSADYAEVVKPYLDGRDITRNPVQQPTRYTIDFGQMSLERAMRFPAALEVLRRQGKEARETSNSDTILNRAETRSGTRAEVTAAAGPAGAQVWPRVERTEIQETDSRGRLTTKSRWHLVLSNTGKQLARHVQYRLEPERPEDGLPQVLESGGQREIEALAPGGEAPYTLSIHSGVADQARCVVTWEDDDGEPESAATLRFF